MTGKPRSFHYQSYILRLWQEGSKAERGWRFSLEDTLTGQRRGFGSLAALVAHLRWLIEEGERRNAEREGRR